MFELLQTTQPRRPLLALMFFALVLAEMLWLYWRGRRGYHLGETAASTVVALGNGLIRPFTATLLLPVFFTAYEHRLLDLPTTGAGPFLLLFFVVDFTYYWMHRLMHRLRWCWATHSVHHSTTHFNLSAAYRLGWTELLSGTWLFMLLLVWLGAPPAAVIGAFALNLVFQFFLHTEAVGHLGRLEWLFNTPSHHRVHHACNEALLDRNFGGVLIVWDRLFGTYAEAAPGEVLRYGLHGTAASHNPLAIVFGEWRRLAADIARSGSPLAALRTAFSRP